MKKNNMTKSKILDKLANGSKSEQREAKEQIAPTPPEIVEGFTFPKDDKVMIEALMNFGYKEDEFQQFPQDETKWFLPL